MTAPDNVLVCGRLAGGALASAQVASVPWHGRGMKLEVYGSEGTLVASTIGTTQIDPVSLLGARSEDRDIQELSIPGRLSYVPEGAPFNVARMYQGLCGRYSHRPEVGA